MCCCVGGVVWVRVGTWSERCVCVEHAHGRWEGEEEEEKEETRQGPPHD